MAFCPLMSTSDKKVECPGDGCALWTDCEYSEGVKERICVLNKSSRLMPHCVYILLRIEDKLKRKET